MPDATQYFAAIRAEKDRLDKLYPTGYLYVISTQNLNMGSTPGTVSHVSTRMAAKHLAENTARIASESDIADFHARSQAFAARMATQKFNRQKTETSGVTITLNRGEL